jgi:hypothetical protein
MAFSLPFFPLLSHSPLGLIETNPARAVPAPNTVQTVSGPLFEEVVQTYKGVYDLQQRVRVAKGSDYIQVCECMPLCVRQSVCGGG